MTTQQIEEERLAQLAEACGVHHRLLAKVTDRVEEQEIEDLGEDPKWVKCGECRFLLPENEVNRKFYPYAAFPICGRRYTPHTCQHVDEASDGCTTGVAWVDDQPPRLGVWDLPRTDNEGE